MTKSKPTVSPQCIVIKKILGGKPSQSYLNYAFCCHMAFLTFGGVLSQLKGGDQTKGKCFQKVLYFSRVTRKSRSKELLNIASVTSKPATVLYAIFNCILKQKTFLGSQIAIFSVKVSEIQLLTRDHQVGLSISKEKSLLILHSLLSIIFFKNQFENIVSGTQPFPDYSQR